MIGIILSWILMVAIIALSIYGADYYENHEEIERRKKWDEIHEREKDKHRKL